MKALAALLLLALQPSSCAPAPKPEPPPRPAPAPIVEQPDAARPLSSCQRACVRMTELGCLGSATTPDGKSCEDVFCSVDASWDYTCMANATTCAQLDRCNP